jgi:serine/threonine-protein kinase
MDVLERLRRSVSTTLGAATSFHEELGELLLQRCRLAFGIGFLIGIAVYLFYGIFVEIRPAAETIFTPHVAKIYDLYPLTLGLATLVLLLRSWGTQAVLFIDYVTVSIILLVSLFIAAVYDLNEVPAFAISLALFIHAAIIPVNVGSQAGLAGTATLAYPAAMVVAYLGVPEIRQFWVQNGGVEEFRRMVLEGTFYLAVLGGVSVLITKALYNMRRSLHEARRLGSYVLEKELGRGGMGQVYAAQHALMCRPTAVKVIHAEKELDESAVARFEREVRLSAALTHPNTITIYDYGRTTDNTFYYAMEYLEGLDLQSLVERFGPMCPERVIYVLQQVCGSLGEAHARGVIHRDIKPSNIYLTQQGGIHDFAKVLDFGLAKEIGLDDPGTLTKSGMIFGTPTYFAPESIEGGDKIDGRADIYNLGGVAHWMLTGQPPFKRATALEVILDHVRSEPTKPSEISEIEIPPVLDDIVLKCLAKRPADRFQSAAELCAALASVPLAHPWTVEQAREWWTLHEPEARPSAGEPTSPAEPAVTEPRVDLPRSP